MASIKEALTQKKGLPFKKPLKGTVVCTSSVQDYTSQDGGKKQYNVAAIADGTTTAKMVVYNQSLFTKIAEGKTLIFHNIILKEDQSFVLANSSRAFLTAFMEVPTERHAEGNQLVNPPPAPISPLKHALASPHKKKISIKGAITQEEAPQTVNVRNEQVTIRTIYMADETEKKCKVTLWRDLANADIRNGDYAVITDCVVNIFKNETSLNTTSRSTISKTTAPMQVKKLTIQGACVTENHVELLSTDDEVYTVDVAILQAALPGGEDMEQYFASSEQRVISLNVKGSDVLSVDIYA